MFNGEYYDYRDYKSKNTKLVRSDTVALNDKLTSDPKSIYDDDWMGSFVQISKHKAEVKIGRCMMGQKPLYYHSHDDFFMIGSSEPMLAKVIALTTGKKVGANTELLSQLISRRRLQDFSQSLYNGIKKWPPNVILKQPVRALFDENILQKEIDKEFVTRWKIFTSHSQTWFKDFNIRNNIEDSIASVGYLAKEIKGGIFISGGVDSAILANCVKHNRSFKNFYTYDSGTCNSELNDAQLTAEHHGIENLKVVGALKFASFNEMVLTIQQIINRAGCLPHSFSALCFNNLCRSAVKDGCKVILTGQGADELYMGYRKYNYLSLISRNISLKMRLIAIWQSLFLGIIALRNNDTSWHRYVPFRKRKYASYQKQLLELIEAKHLDAAKRQQLKDIIWDSMPDIFSYEDNIGLSYGLEVRVPFLSAKSAIPALHAPTSELYTGTGPKGALKKAFWDILPNHIKRMKTKKGFVNEWTDYLQRWHREIVTYLSVGSLGLNSDLWSVSELEAVQKSINSGRTIKNADLLFKFIVIECFLKNLQENGSS